MVSPRRRLNFENVPLSPQRLERYMRIVTAANEFRRLAALNLNSYTPRNRSLAISFMRDVINGTQGNWPALNRAVANLNKVRRIGGGNISPARRSPARKAATKIQSLARGVAARKRAAARRTKLVMGPNGSFMVAVPAYTGNRTRA